MLFLMFSCKALARLSSLTATANSWLLRSEPMFNGWSLNAWFLGRSMGPRFDGQLDNHKRRACWGVGRASLTCFSTLFNRICALPKMVSGTTWRCNAPSLFGPSKAHSTLRNWLVWGPCLSPSFASCCLCPSGEPRSAPRPPLKALPQLCPPR